MLEELNNNQEYNPQQHNDGFGDGDYGHGGNGNGDDYGNGNGGNRYDNGKSIPYPLDAVDLLIRLAAQHVVKPTGETR